MTRPTPQRALDELLTYDDVIRMWQALDERLAREELQQPRHLSAPSIVVVARCVLAVVIATVLVALPPLLRAVGG